MTTAVCVLIPGIDMLVNAHVEGDILPASMEIQLNDPRDSSAVADKLKGEGLTESSTNRPLEPSSW